MRKSASGVHDSWRQRFAGVAQMATPLAVLALVAIAARLTNDARLAEQRHRATAEGALRDYAGYASWQLSRHLAGDLRSHLNVSTSPVRDIPIERGQLLHPRVLTERSRECDCGFKGDVTLAFRLDLPSGRPEMDRSVPRELTEALVRWLPAAADRITNPGSAMGSGGVAHDNLDLLRRSSALAFETLGGQPLVVAYSLVTDQARRTRAVYGVAAGLSHLADDYGRVLATEALLPPSLTVGFTSDSVLAVRVVHPKVGTIFQTAVEPSIGMSAHTDTLPAWLGGQIMTVAIRPEFAGKLLIGGIPPSRLPLQLTLLAVAIALAIVALVEIRLTRELGRLREQFVANVSHELRTPLAPISMQSETLMLGRERSAAERRDFASIVFRESRGKARKALVVTKAHNVAREVREGVEAFSSIAHASRATIMCQVRSDVAMRTDPAAFRQVLLNLLDNAVKFGPHGQTVVVAAEQRDGMVCLSVADQGRGICEADRSRVFDAYTRVETPGSTSVTGAGIGLSVVKELVAACGGTVWIDAPPGGVGARVTFAMPRAG